MGMIVDNRLAQDQIDAKIDTLNAELRMLKSHRNALSPISQLPLEVLHSIYLRVERQKRLIPVPVILSQVCRSWRELVVSFPSLWTDIRLTRGTNPPLLDLMLNNSLEHPIRVSYQNRWHRASELAFAIQKMLSAPERLKSLDLDCDRKDLEMFLLHAHGRANSLEFLRIHHYQADFGSSPLPAHILSGGTPQLRHLELEGCYFSWDSPLLLQSPLTRLIVRHRHFDCRVSLRELRQVLRCSGGLQFLELQLHITASADDLEGDPVPTNLPYLNHLKVYGDLDELNNFLRSIRIPISIGVLNLTSVHTKDPQKLLFALKSALGDPDPDEFIAPRQLQLFKYLDELEWDELETHAGIRCWRDFPTSEAGALRHAPRGPVWKGFAIRTPDERTNDTALFPFLQWQAQTAFWTLADLRHLEMGISEAHPSAWAVFAQLPNLEEVIVLPGASSKDFLVALSPSPAQSNTTSSAASSLPREEDPPGAAVTLSPYPFPALRTLILCPPSCDLALLHEVLESRQRLGACLEHLEFENLVPPPAIRQSMSSVATNVVWNPVS